MKSNNTAHYEFGLFLGPHPQPLSDLIRPSGTFSKGEGKRKQFLGEGSDGPKYIAKWHKLLLLVALTLNFQLLTFNSFSQGITQVTGFGSNPGALNMYDYVPSGITSPAALVIAMHGCTQTASEYALQSGWNKLANLHKFYVVYPEQVVANNSSKCFNWFDTTDTNKNHGEALSIKQMVDHMITTYSIDSSAIFVTGLSAGAGMTVVMLADYPQLFNKGAVMAGVPYRAATSSLNAFTAMNGGVIKTASQWGALVKTQNPTYTGSFPHVAIFHGSSDMTVNIANATELIKQWTNLNNADQTADSTNNAFDGNSIVQQTIYNDNLNNPVVHYYKVTGMGHAISLDTGACPRQGGATATYALDKNFHSTYWAARFFNILVSPYSISGAIQVAVSATNITYSVPATTGSTYVWTVPTGATIVSGQGSNSIIVNFGSSSGTIQVTETTSGNCKKEPAKLYVDVTGSTSVDAIVNEPLTFFYSKEDNSLIINRTTPIDLNSLMIYNTIGQKINQTYSIHENKINFSSELKPGIYFVNVIILQKQYGFKMVVN